MSVDRQQQVETLISGLQSGLIPTDALARAGLGAGRPVPKEIALCIQSSRLYGSSLLPSLREIASSWQTEELLKSELEGEFSAPRATIKLVTWLPLAAMALALCLGFDVETAMHSPVSLVSIGIGASLIWAARRWCHSILSKALPKQNQDVLHLRQLCIVLAAGATLRQAIAQVDLPASAYELIVEDLSYSRTTGSAALPCVRRNVERLMQRATAQDRQRVREAGVKLSVPLGVAVLPALVFLVVIPMFNSAAFAPNAAI